MEFIILLLLLIANGLLAMYELALVSASRIKLTSMAERGDTNAKRVLRQLKNSEQTLSAIQIGITLIGIVSGAFGGMAISSDVEVWLRQLPFLAKYATTLSLILTVAAITYLSLVVGELVPKAIALSRPEHYAKLLSGPIAALTWICYPFVAILSLSTKCIGRLLGVKADQVQSLTQDEIKLLLKESSERGVINKQESEMLRDVFSFSDKRVCELMTPRPQLVMLHKDDSQTTVLDTMKQHNYSKYLLVDKTADEVLGVVAVKDVLQLMAETDQPFALTKVVAPPLFLPESIPASKALELFKQNKTKFGVVVDEYGGTEGIVTLSDLTESIFGDIVEEGDNDVPDIIRREDGTLLVEGSMNLSDFIVRLNLKEDPDLEEQRFNTVAGLVMYLIGRLPHTADIVHYQGLCIEIVDMDGERIDKLLVSDKPSSASD